jgi:hypothetical protein
MGRADAVGTGELTPSLCGEQYQVNSVDLLMIGTFFFTDLLEVNNPYLDAYFKCVSVVK